MLNNVIRSEIYKEFTPKEREYWFGITNKAVRHHVDTLYYNVYLKDDGPGESTPNIAALVNKLAYLKQVKRDNPKQPVDYFELAVNNFGAAGGIYLFGLKCEEHYDIFVADRLPNADTPRIQVQLRTYSLVIDGLYGAIEKSFEKVKEILGAYDIEIYDVKENRIDYAFHNNVIQKPLLVFSDDSLDKHLVTPTDHVVDHKKVAHRTDEHLDKDYLSIASRKSNYLFMRAYNKAKEVVQMNYKGFFFKLWRESGLISRYDEYVYQKAYELKSWATGCLYGRICWYIEHGKNEERRAAMIELLKKYYLKSSNNNALKNAIKGVLPPNTVVFNVEFESKRKFYSRLDSFIDTFVFMQEKGDPYLKRIYKILSLRREFIDKIMTSFVIFVDDRFDTEGSKEQDWWYRLRRCKIDDCHDKAILEANYKYCRKLDEKRARRRFYSNLAGYQMIKKNTTDDLSFGESIWDVISNVNDNDKKENEREDSIFKREVEDYLKSLENNPLYKEAYGRKKQQLGSLIRKNQDETYVSDVGYALPKEALDGYGISAEDRYRSLEATHKAERATADYKQVEFDREYFKQQNLLKSEDIENE